MSDNAIRISMAIIEGINLAGLVDEFTGILAAGEDAADPGIDRLTPDVYPEDAEASAEFSSATRAELLDRRAADASIMRRSLSPLLRELPEDLAEDAALEHRDVTIQSDEIDAWLRTLTAMRLVIATRLGITADDEDHDPEDPRFGVYDWLAYRLDTLIELADAWEEPADPDDSADDHPQRGSTV